LVETYLFLEVDRLACEIHALGVNTGDLVALFMTNSPEMVFVIYALSKLGAAPALINAALRGMLPILKPCI
jgi:acyl-coenzyme A synthetase/AMP-(fatty) acid ligase